MKLISQCKSLMSTTSYDLYLKLQDTFFLIQLNMILHTFRLMLIEFLAYTKTILLAVL